MSKQQSIINFLQKRKINTDTETINNKKSKTNDDSDIENSLNVSNEIKYVDGNSLKSLISLKWYKIFENEFQKPYFKNLEKFLQSERDNKRIIYPPLHQIFSWSFYCDIDRIKVVIIGQDPYHGPQQANGLAFSVEKNVSKPPSLINIFKEIKMEYPEFQIPTHGDLKQWSRQGVLLLNATLTVRKNEPNSHSNCGWENFTDSIIRYINNEYENRVFILWGNYAQKKCSFINTKKHLVLKSVHPSPLSANRGFFGCNHFLRTNDYLKKNKMKPIDWCQLD